MGVCCVVLQSCPDPEVDIREQQCTRYNNETFRGQQYQWEAYVKGRSRYPANRSLSHRLISSLQDDAECELNCKPMGMSYFATLNDSVIDGTPCQYPVDFVHRNHSGRAMCVEGVCKVSERISVFLFFCLLFHQGFFSFCFDNIACV